MVQVFQHVSTLWGAAQPGLAPLRDLHLFEADQGLVVYSLSGPYPGLQAMAWTPGGAAPVSVTVQQGTGQAGIAPQIVTAQTAAGADMALILGAGQTGLGGTWLDGAGRFGAGFQPGATGTVPDDLAAVAVRAAGSVTHVYGLTPDDRIPIHWHMNASGGLSLRHPGGVAASGAGATDLVVAGDWLVTGGGEELLELYLLPSSGTPLRWSGISAAQNPGLAGAITLQSALLDGTDYVIAAAAGSSTLSVFRITDQGRLELTDHLIDSRDSRFSTARDLEVVQTGGRVYVAAGGGDSGVSLLQLLPGGRLLHMGVVADAAGTSMDGLAAMDLAADAAGDLILVTGGLRDPGLSLFHHDLDLSGGFVQAAPGGGSATGGAGQDTLMDAVGSDTLTGGAGADTFVLVTDGREDTVTDFNPAQDRLDLSGWAFLRGPDQLEIASRVDGALVFFAGPAGDEALYLLSHDGQPITPEAVAASILTGPDGFLPAWLDTASLRPPDGSGPDPQTVTGTPEADTLEAGGGDDTVTGRAGSDLLGGGLGADLIDAGIGFDTLFGGPGNDTLRAQDGWDSLDGGSGADWLFGNNGNDTLLGGADGDQIFGGVGTDVLYGDDGNDTLQGDPGIDRLEGGAGDDLLRGNAGPDVLLGGVGEDTLEGGINHDILDGGDGNDMLYGNNGADQLNGGAGHDTLFGNAGPDTLESGGGWDVMNGGIGTDTFVFRGGGTVRIEDFQNNIDTLALDAALWGGQARSVHQILSEAVFDNGLVVLDYGGMGQLEIAGLDVITALLDDIVVI